MLLRPHKDKYLDQALGVRETVTYSWQRGAASLMAFLKRKATTARCSWPIPNFSEPI